MPLHARAIGRFLGRAAAVLILLLLLAVSTVAFVGGRRLSRSHDVVTHAVEPATGTSALARGRRLAAFWGCTGCHESDGGGGVMFESPAGDRLVAPNLTRIVREYSPDELERGIRHGVRRDGSSVVVMPSSMFAGISDDDLAALLGYLRTLPAVPDSLPDRRLGLMARALVLMEDGVLQADRIDHGAAHPATPAELGSTSSRADTLALGAYLARTGCPECHGPDLRGSDFGDTPDLRIVGAYSLEQFRRLAREGVGLDGQEKGMMSGIARGRIARLTDPELTALHAYLRTLAD